MLNRSLKYPDMFLRPFTTLFTTLSLEGAVGVFEINSGSHYLELILKVDYTINSWNDHVWLKNDGDDDQNIQAADCNGGRTV